MTAVALREVAGPGGPGAAEAARAPAPSWLPALTAVAALGLLALSLAYAGARDARSWADPLFWTSLAVMFAPFAVRLLSAGPGRDERLGLVLALGVALYGAKVLHSPNGFTFHDELGFQRGTDAIRLTGELLRDNPIVGAYAFYPGLQEVTAALAQLSGLSIFVSGLVVVGIARGVLMVVLFVLIERIASARVAGLAALVYVANPNFLFFDAQFAYESLAIPLAGVALLLLTRPTAGSRVAAAVCLAAVVVTHHVTSYALAIVLVLWALVARRRDLVGFALLAAATVAAWALVAGGATDASLGPVARDAAHGLGDLLTGASGGQKPFSSASGYVDPVLERAVGLASVALLLVALPFALLATWRERGRHPLVVVLGLGALAYPATLVLRLTGAGTETSNRASEFLFAGLGLAIGLLLVRRRGRLRTDRGPVRLTVAAGLVVVFLGGLIVGWAPYARLPGPYQVEAASRSVEPRGVRAAQWAGEHLAPGSIAFADATNKGLLAAYGRLNPQGGSLNGVPTGRLILSPVFGDVERSLVVGNRVRYLLVDRRLGRAIPRTGRYFDSGDPTPNRYRRPVSRAALAKFDAVPRLDRIFSEGEIVLYDASVLLADRRAGR